MKIIQQHIKSGKNTLYRLAEVLFLSLCLLLGACEQESYDPEPDPVRTLLFYMGGDNNLSSEVNSKVEKIKAVPLSPYCRVLIYTDTKDSHPKLLEVVGASGGNILKTLREYDESNSADAVVFASILREIKEFYPSPSYGLVLFSHATGWLPEGTYDKPVLRSEGATLRSVVLDEGTEMEIPAFATAIPNGMFDFIVFEACYMASVEVAYELKDKTKYIIASSAEIVSPGFSRCYDKALPYLYGAKADLVGFCRTVEADYKTRSGDYSSLTLSLINTTKLYDLAEVVRSLPVPQSKAGIQAFDRKGGNLFFDLSDSYSGMTEQQAITLQTAISRCVEWKAATAAFMPTYGGFEVRTHSGLTTYIEQVQYPHLNEEWKDFEWYWAITEHYRDLN